MVQELVNNFGTGIKVNEIYNNYLQARTNTQFIKYLNQIKKFRTGTYKEMNLEAYLENIGFKPSCFNSENFLQAVKNVYNNKTFILFNGKSWNINLTK